MYDDFDVGPQSDEYTDSDRLDEMEQARGDYNLWEEEQVFQDREYEQESPADWEDDGYDYSEEYD
jgi:hypothetical protein